ncbi:MAG: hypothetical protein KOO60_07425 [Gemmatimonadales bacterium]|nr:hypothetical protein [Gemmatimonadales bacterium]
MRRSKTLLIGLALIGAVFGYVLGTTESATYAELGQIDDPNVMAAALDPNTFDPNDPNHVMIQFDYMENQIRQMRHLYRLHVQGKVIVYEVDQPLSPSVKLSLRQKFRLRLRGLGVAVSRMRDVTPPN